MISTSRTSDFQISGSAISSHKNIQQSYERSFLILNYFIKVVFLSVYDESIAIGDKNGTASIVTPPPGKAIS